MKTSIVKVTYHELVLLEQAHAIERTGALSATTVNDITLGLRRRDAKQHDPKAFMLDRAREIVARVGPEATPVDSTSRLTFKTLTFVLASLTFILGALTSQWSQSSHVLNLLDFPLMGWVIWNLAIYVLLMLSSFMPAACSFLPWWRQGLTWLLQRQAPWVRLRQRSAAQAAFNQAMQGVRLKQTRFDVTHILHTMALCTTLGFLVNLALRGFHTAWYAGWESTWITNAQTANAWLYAMFGWWSEPFLAWPSLEGIAELHLQAAHPSLVLATPWLARMMLLLVISVIIPRSLLLLINHYRQRYQFKRLEVDLSTYGDALQERATTLDVLIINASTRDNQAILDRLASVLTHPPRRVEMLNFNPWLQPIENLAGLIEHTPRQVWVVVNLADIPEEATAGAMLEVLQDKLHAPMMIALWPSTYQVMPQKVTAWQDFAKPYHLEAHLLLDDVKSLQPFAERLAR